MPTKHTTQVSLIKMHISEGGPAKIKRSGNTTRSRKRSLRQTTMHDTNATDSEQASGDTRQGITTKKLNGILAWVLER
jgi:hypothetical protein